METPATSRMALTTFIAAPWAATASWVTMALPRATEAEVTTISSTVWASPAAASAARAVPADIAAASAAAAAPQHKSPRSSGFIFIPMHPVSRTIPAVRRRLLRPGRGAKAKPLLVWGS